MHFRIRLDSKYKTITENRRVESVKETIAANKTPMNIQNNTPNWLNGITHPFVVPFTPFSYSNFM